MLTAGQQDALDTLYFAVLNGLLNTEKSSKDLLRDEVMKELLSPEYAWIWSEIANADTSEYRETIVA